MNTSTHPKLQNFFNDKEHECHFWLNLIYQMNISENTHGIIVFDPHKIIRHSQNKNDLAFLIITDQAMRNGPYQKRATDMYGDPNFGDHNSVDNEPIYDDILFFAFRQDADSKFKYIIATAEIYPDDLSLFKEGIIKTSINNLKYSDGILLTKEDIPKAYLLLGNQ